MTTETTHGAFSTRSASGRVLEPERESFRLRDPLPDLAILATLLAWVAMLFG